ncbi:MAG: ABC transporter substrate-binding protein, partial [Alphaproteobacteria bacterium]|nr:ABC transporter substrate-binding protein [Alphaproteobacteria bacterium]
MIKKHNFFLVLLCCLAVTFSAKASPVRYKQLSLYGSPLYQSDFTNFKYVNPRAPKGGKIVLPAYGGFDNFNPFILKGIAAPEVAELTLESLGVVPIDDPATVYPLVAKEFEVGSNFVGFILDEKASFSNGDPILADDVIFSYQSLIEKGSPFYRVYYSDVDRVEKENDHHVRFYFKSGSSNKELPLILSQFKIYSKRDWEGKDFAKPTLQKPLGSGPYILEKFSPNKYMVFKRNPDIGQRSFLHAK